MTSESIFFLKENKSSSRGSVKLSTHPNMVTLSFFQKKKKNRKLPHSVKGPLKWFLSDMRQPGGKELLEQQSTCFRVAILG